MKKRIKYFYGKIDMKIILLLLFPLLLFACSKENLTDDRREMNSGNVTEIRENIKLNNGQKWKVNREMMVHVNKLENELLNFDGKSIPDYRILADKIRNQIQKLTQSCTMKGESHDELHKWLHPFIELTNTFAESDTEEAAQEYHSKLNRQMAVFHEYFESE